MSYGHEVVFEQAVDGLLLKALRGRISSRLKERLQRIGVELDQPLAPAYPRATWEQILIVSREEVFPERREADGMRELGRLVANGFAQTLIGKAMSGFVKVVGPMRMMSRMTRNLRAAANYNDTRMTERGPNACEVWINESRIHPEYCAGLLEAALVYAGAKEPKVEVLQRDELGTTYTIHW